MKPTLVSILPEHKSTPDVSEVPHLNQIARTCLLAEGR